MVQASEPDLTPHPRLRTVLIIRRQQRERANEGADSPMAEATSGGETVHGHIAARIDRLPLTQVQ
jgi:hypothetical protein